MCCIFWTLDHPIYQFICASNRDEFLARPTTVASWHSFPPPQGPSSSSSSSGSKLNVQNHNESDNASAARSVLSGLDAHPSGGGTWLGLTRTGAFAALTNFTEAPPPLPAGLDAFKSRGTLVRGWLEKQAFSRSHSASSGSGSDAEGTDPQEELSAYLDGVASEKDHYPGFNLLVGQLARPNSAGGPKAPMLGYLSNRETPGAERLADPASEPTPGGRRAKLTRSGPRIFGAGPESGGSGTDEEGSADARDGKVKGVGCVACGLSNSVLLEPWVKVWQGEKLFEETVLRFDEGSKGGGAEAGRTEEERLVEGLFELLSTSSAPHLQSRTEMRSSILVPPIDLPIPSQTQASTDSHSQANTPADDTSKAWYATRTATVVLVTRTGRAVFVERDVHVLDGQKEPKRVPSGGKDTQRRYEWDIE